MESFESLEELGELNTTRGLTAPEDSDVLFLLDWKSSPFLLVAECAPGFDFLFFWKEETQRTRWRWILATGFVNRCPQKNLTCFTTDLDAAVLICRFFPPTCDYHPF